MVENVLIDATLGWVMKMRMWFAKNVNTGEYIISLRYSEVFEKGNRVMLSNGETVVGLGSYRFDGYDDYKLNWKDVVRYLEGEVFKDD